MSATSRPPPQRWKPDFVHACVAVPNVLPGNSRVAGDLSTVSRALRLIAESDLQDGGIEDLAERLGVGSRHLRRLFLKHLGATPGAVVQTRRLQFAKKLIDETSLPMSEVALAAGFGCVRRFNATIRQTYQRTPTQIRRLARKIETRPRANTLLLALSSPLPMATHVVFSGAARHSRN